MAPNAKEAAATNSKRSFMPLQKRKQLERDLEHVTEEMYRRNMELAQTNQVLSLLRTIDALVLESHTSVRMVCEHITEAIAQATGFPFVGLLTRSSRTREVLTLNGWSGSGLLGQADPSLGLPRPLHVELVNEWFMQIESTKLLNVADINDQTIADFLGYRTDTIKSLRKRVPLQSLYIIKLKARRRLVGLLVIGFASPMTQLPDNQLQLIDRVSESIGVALDNKLLFEENQYVLRQLKLTNAKLKALDEAKDDFVSMASHQLRTPLTSVKGYLSMLLEGDGGKITPTQRNMLNQAFISSQHMVYLIADLLNVSRLKTGKFIIETSMVDLAAMVQEEVDQLQDTAASRSLTLSYDKPKNIPDLMLDETKTRQVIMNFIDNAIYYTPAGGKIEVKVLDTGPTIEMRVIDNGLGVPKSEQPHLFTKFYRAGNARKARPDGTGLGLFMAKKVIVAQGGSLIFESQEGKGSTFGFSFSKSRVAVPAQDKPATAVAAS